MRRFPLLRIRPRFYLLARVLLYKEGNSDGLMKQPRHFCILFTAMAALFASQTASASHGNAVTEQYATASDGTPLHWDVYMPAGHGPWPAVILIHGGEFKLGGPSTCAEAGTDLARAGYVAFAIEYRLAPPGKLVGQVSEGHYPDQTNDVKLAVIAARHDHRSNGSVAAVGGSAGGSHAVFVATTGRPGFDQVDACVSLSGAYDYPDVDNSWNPAFQDAVTNYVGVPITDTAALQAASPAFQTGVVAPPPIFMIASALDPMPPRQLPDLLARLAANSVTDYEQLIIPGDLHAFDYWSTVKSDVIAFLGTNLTGAAHNTQELINLSTRAAVHTGDGGLIGGFIVTGTTPKNVVLRGLGPSLASDGVTGVLADPVLSVYDVHNSLVAQNDNWTAPLPDEVVAAGLTPAHPNESLIATILPPGHYTAVLQGKNDSTGVGLLEIYDLDPASSHVSNISTRGEVVGGDGAMIGGFINGGTNTTKVLVRAIGPSLTGQGIANALPNPTLELRDAQGNLILANDNWRSSQEQEIEATGIPPTDDLESAIVATLPPGHYTATVTGVGGATGVALVEVYDLD